MLKLPVCPHCHTIYRYGDVKNTLYEKNHKCYHCNKIFIISKIRILFLFIIIALIAAIFNVFELYMMAGINFIALLVTNIIIITVGILLIPFFVKFKICNDFSDKMKRKKSK